MTETARILSEQIDKIQDIECLLTAISNINPGGPESRLADMAAARLKEVESAIDELELNA